MRTANGTGRIALAVVVVSGFCLGGCGHGNPKPPTIAGCDAPPGDDADIGMRIVVKELRRLGTVTGEPRASQFAAIFDRDQIKADPGAMYDWYALHENDRDLQMYGTSPGNWGELLGEIFPKQYSAYTAYCTGFSLADYARTHPLPLWASMAPYTPTPSATSPSPVIQTTTAGSPSMAATEGGTP